MELPKTIRFGWALINRRRAKSGRVSKVPRPDPMPDELTLATSQSDRSGNYDWCAKSRLSTYNSRSAFQLSISQFP